MGILRVKATAYSADGRLREAVELVVDTGSTLTWIEAATLRRLGYEPIQSRLFQTIKGEDIWREVGDATLECNGIRATVGTVFAGPGEAQVLGVTALERMGLEVDPIRPALREVRAYLALAGG